MNKVTDEKFDLSDYLFDRARTFFDRPDQIIYIMMDTFEAGEFGKVNEEMLLKWYRKEHDKKQDPFSSALTAIENVWEKLQEKKGTPDRTIQEALYEKGEAEHLEEEEIREVYRKKMREKHYEIGEIL